MGPREPIQPDERVTGITLSPLAKVLLIASGGVVIGIFLGVAVTRILDEVHSDAPHLPTISREDKDVEPWEEPEKVNPTDAPQSLTPSIVEVARELGIDLEEK